MKLNDYIAQITLDLNCNNNIVCLSAGQFDKGRKIEITVTADGKNFDCTGCSATLKGMHSDLTAFAAAATVTVGKVIVTLDESVLSVSGKAVAKLVLSDGDKTFSTNKFIISVDSALDGDIAQSEYFSVLNRLIDKIMLIDASGGILVDDIIDADSIHPVQNKVIAAALNAKITTDKIDNGAVTSEKLSAELKNIIDDRSIKNFEQIVGDGLTQLASYYGSGDGLHIYRISSAPNAFYKSFGIDITHYRPMCYFMANAYEQFLFVPVEGRLLTRTAVSFTGSWNPWQEMYAKIADGSVTTSKLAQKAVTNDKIADGVITPDKISNTAVITSKLANGCVTIPKLGDDVKEHMQTYANIAIVDVANSVNVLNDCTDNSKIYMINGIIPPLGAGLNVTTGSTYGYLHWIGNSQKLITVDRVSGTTKIFSRSCQRGEGDQAGVIIGWDDFTEIFSSGIKDGFVTADKLSAEVKNQIDNNAADITQLKSDVSGKATTDYVDNAIANTVGDINTALTELNALADSYITGGSQ